MKFKFFKSMIACLILSITSSTYAGIISASNTDTEYAAGYFADLQDLEWLTWDTTAYLTRVQIENNAMDLLSNGWRYASVSEFDTLFDSLKKGYINDSQNYRSEWSEGTKWLWRNFDPLDYLGNFGAGVGRNYSRIGDLRYGGEGECGGGTQYGCRGHMRAYDDPAGWLYAPYHDGSYSVHDNELYVYTRPDQAVSHVLVRAAHVPEPSTLAIFALGMIGLASRRFKKQS